MWICAVQTHVVQDPKKIHVSVHFKPMLFNGQLDVYKCNGSKKDLVPSFAFGKQDRRYTSQKWGKAQAHLRNSVDLGLARIQKCQNEDWWGRTLVGWSSPDLFLTQDSKSKMD